MGYSSVMVLASRLPKDGPPCYNASVVFRKELGGDEGAESGELESMEPPHNG
jgi:hypothetical protein